MHILAILGVCYFPLEQGSLKSKPIFYHSLDDTFELSFSETWYHKSGHSNLMTYVDYLEIDLCITLCKRIAQAFILDF